MTSDLPQPNNLNKQGNIKETLNFGRYSLVPSFP